jgi:hypothetical protein
MSAVGTGETVGIEITMATTQPPQGEVAVVGGHPQPFVGWLQLLRILVEAVAPRGGPTDPTPPQASSPQGATS